MDDEMKDMTVGGCGLIGVLLGAITLPSCAALNLAEGSPWFALALSWIGGLNFGTFVSALRWAGRNGEEARRG
jgi:hypothetical protein